MQTGFSRIDDTLIERVFQPLADLTTDRIGLDRLTIVRLCLDAASVACILAQAGALTQAVTQWEPGEAFGRAGLLLLELVALSSLRMAFGRVGGSRGTNSLRVTMLPHRCVVLALLVGRLLAPTGFAGMADLAMLGFAACALYLGACVTRRPLRRRARWLATFGVR
jgi:hypothetical protein